MALTKLQTLTLVQNLIDDTAAKLWSAANLAILAEGTIDELYTELLEQFPWFNSLETPEVPVAPGYVNLATGVTRFHRIQQVSRAGQDYNQADPRDVVIENDVVISAPNNTYVVLGDRLYLFPLDATTTIYLRHSALPTGFGSLADGDAVVWPDGHHMAFVYAIAARAMEKGDRENSERFEKRAEAALMKCKARLRKQRTGPIVPWLNSDVQQWGGE